MADRLADAPADQTSGEYLHTTRVNVYRDFQYPRPTNGAESPLVVTLHQMWRSPDGSKGRRLSAQYDNGKCTPDDDSTWNDKRYQESFRPHASADMDMKRLRSLLVSGAGRDPVKPVDVLAGIAGTAEDDVVDKHVRAAMLRILAEQPGLVAREGATDQLGRTGVLVTLLYVDSEKVKSQYHLLFRQTTGELLSTYETLVELPATFDPRLGPDAAASAIAAHDGVRLYLDSRYATLDTAAAVIGCGSLHNDVVRDLSRTLATAPPRQTASLPATGLTP